MKGIGKFSALYLTNVIFKISQLHVMLCVFQGRYLKHACCILPCMTIHSGLLFSGYLFFPTAGNRNTLLHLSGH